MLTFTVIEIAPQEAHCVIRVQVGSGDPSITTGDVFNIVTTHEIASFNQVGRPLAVGDRAEIATTVLFSSERSGD
jgi:hypothetical protein